MRVFLEASVSVRLLWPLSRVAEGSDPIVGNPPSIAAGFADPEARVPRAVALDFLDRAVRSAGDPAFGLRAGAAIEPGDFDVVEYAARSAPTLGEASQCLARHYPLLDEAADWGLHVEGDAAVIRLALRPGHMQSPAANDFTVAAALGFSRRNSESYEPPLEVLLAHSRPSHAHVYEDAFETRVRFDAPFNAIIVRRERLSIRMRQANPGAFRAFERHAQERLRELERTASLSARLRRDVADLLPLGAATMAAIAERRAMAVATLRRHLEDEGTTFASILEEVRRDLAIGYLHDLTVSLTEIAARLGYTNAGSFVRAFKRWTGTTPMEQRARDRIAFTVGGPSKT